MRGPCPKMRPPLRVAAGWPPQGYAASVEAAPSSDGDPKDWLGRAPSGQPEPTRVSSLRVWIQVRFPLVVSGGRVVRGGQAKPEAVIVSSHLWRRPFGPHLVGATNLIGLVPTGRPIPSGTPGTATSRSTL